MRIIAGEARGRVIEAPSGLHTRPTLDRVRENLFNMIQYVVPGSNVLDLFAGSGALSLEALSRGASYAVLNDIERNAYLVQRKNITVLKYEGKTKQLHGDWRTALIRLQKEKNCFDIVFLDPPYSMLDLTEVFSGLIPLIKNDTLIIVEHEAKKQPSVNKRFHAVKNRSWGFCAVTIYQLSDKEECE